MSFPDDTPTGRVRHSLMTQHARSVSLTSDAHTLWITPLSVINSVTDSVTNSVTPR